MTAEADYLAARRVASDPATALAERAVANARARGLRRVVGPYRTAELDDQVHAEVLADLARAGGDRG